MNSSRNNSSFNSFAGGTPKYVMEVVIAITAVAVIYFLLGSFQLINAYINRLEANRVDLLPLTYVMNSGPQQIVQNPNLPNALTALPSSNEPTGVEFTYSFFINVPQQAFNTSGPIGLKHIFHKGSPGQYPLLGPGVYMHSQTNTMRIYMNTYDTWNNFAEVPNFPVGKYVHITIVCRSMHLEIYVNGNIASRIGFNISPPYQNYGDIYAFYNSKPRVPTTLPSLEGDTSFQILGVCEGQLSRLTYFNYALSYSEINKMMNQGPSPYVASQNGSNTTTYLVDNWWTANFTQ
jgi:hypothetical protein